MGTNTETNIFLWIEKKMNVTIPTYLKNVLNCCGYDNCHSIATIVNGDIEYFADEIKKGSGSNGFKDKLPSGNGTDELMEGCIDNIEASPSLSRGHIKLLLAIVQVVKNTLETEGSGSFTLKSRLKPTSISVRSCDGVSGTVEEDNASNASTVHKKRFKFSTSSPVSIESCFNETADTEKIARSTLIKKAMVVLITHTPKLLANVGIPIVISSPVSSVDSLTKN